MPPDALGVATQGLEQEGESTDYLGQKVPISFRGQPALPTAGPVTPGAAPPTTAAGTVRAAPQPQLPGGGGGETTFADLAGVSGGGVDPGGSESGGTPGPGVGTGIAGEGLPGLSQTVGPEGRGAQVSLSPLGQLSVGVNTGNKDFDAVVNTLGRQAASFYGIPTSTNLVGLLGQIVGSPIMSTLGAALSFAGLPMTVINLVDIVARMFSGSVASTQASNAALDIEQLEAMTPQQIAQLAYSAQGPTAAGWTNTFQLTNRPDDVAMGVGAEPGAGTGEGPGAGGGPGSGSGSGAPGAGTDAP